MIPQIQQINFPAYASLTNAVATFAEMGERTISTQIKIDGDIVPDFTGWELSFKGERFVLPVREPQAAKDNTSRRSMVDLVFYSWPIDELKRYFFVEMSSITSGTAIADKYKASLGLNIENFVVAFNQVLTYYFQGKIVMSLFGSGTGIYSPEPSYFEIDNMKIWDVLQKIYEIYEIRWTIEYDSTLDVYTIKVGYPAAEIDDHEFQYGYNGGLLRFERQVQDYDLTNILLGRGGEKNLPYRYFKEVDPNNPDWAGDPDAIPELANIYFENLRDINFRRYVQGWKTNPNRILAEGQQPDPYDSDRGATDFAYAKGHTDPTFNPVEYVKDDASIATYGERWGILDNADDIYPTIQGIEISPYGRIDQVIYVEPVVTDDIEAMAMNAAEVSNLVGAEQSGWLNANDTLTMDIHGADFTVPAGKVGNLTITGSSLGGWFDTVSYGKKSGKQSTINASDPVNALVSVNTTQSYVVAVDKATSQELPLAGLPAGNYYYKVHVVVKGEFETSMYESVSVTAGVSGVKLTISDSDADAWKPTFDIWVKNIWNTTQGGSESDEAYAARVWEPILGDRVGNEASVSFSTGLLSISEDYNFKIASYPVVDRTKTYGGITSEWRITLIKSDAEYEATGKYIPNADTGGNASAGDYFFFTGIDMPHAYVLWAEEKLNAYKTTELGKLKQINPTWLINIDKVRANTLETGEVEALADRLTCGAKIDISDPRFTNGNTLTLYVQTITYTWQEPSEGNPYIVPDIEVVLSDKVETVTSPIDQLEGDVNLIQASYARVADIESIVRKVAGPLFLKKTGESETSLSPTKFASIVSSDGFRQGDIGGEGWGSYIDGEGHSVLEADILVARKNMRVSSLVVNQVAYLGGKQIISAAALEISKVDTNANGDYVCYFDQKQGSVGNLFVVNDIAMGQVWDAEDTQIRYYKRKVLAVGADYVTLSATIADGTDAPQEGDVLVQYGNYTNTARQYVIIRDVIGGGYERMLSGLSTVNSNGTEYYFAGRQSGSSERWFVGNAGGQTPQYAQYQNGVLTIAGRLAVTTQVDTDGQGNYQSLSAYLENLQNQIDGNVQTWYSSGTPTLQNYPANTWATVEDKNNHIGDLYYDSDTGKGYRFMMDNQQNYLWVQLADEDIAAALALAQQNATAISGLQYLKTATNNGTLVQGGLVLTSLIQLGQNESGVYKVYSGINGIMDQTATGNGIAAWYGGEMLEKATWDAGNAEYQAAHRYAKSLFRFDGSGYLASGNIKWDASGNGEIPGITWNNGRITLSSSIWLQGGDQLTELIDAVNHMYTQFRYDSDHSIVSVVVSDALYIPTSAPLYPLAGKHAFYTDPNGNYSQTPGGGVANLVKLTLTKNNDTQHPLGVYDPAGALDQTIDIPIPVDLADLNTDTTHRVVTDSQITAWGNKYDKPSGGIPASDLASAVQTSLGKADTAYQKPVGGIPSSDLATAYLPLSGGTLTGSLTMGTNSIVFNQATSSTWNTGAGSGLQILNTAGVSSDGAPSSYAVGLSVQGYYGFQLAYDANSTLFMVRHNSGGSATASWLTLIHSGNIGSQSVNYATSAGSAGSAASLSTTYYWGNLAISTTQSYLTTPTFGLVLFRNVANDGNAGYIGRGSTSSNSIQLEAYAGGAVGIGANGSDSDIYVATSHYVGIGNLSPQYKLDVNGAIHSTNIGYFNSGVVSYEAVSVYNSTSDTSYRLTLDSDGAVGHLFNYNDTTQTFGDLALQYGGGNVAIGSITTSYKLGVNGTLGVVGATTLSSTLSVTGATTLGSTLGVTGATTLGSTLGVTGVSTLSGGAKIGTFLTIPTAAPSSSAAWYSANDYYLYANTNGNYSQTPSGGGGGGTGTTTYALTIRVNSTKLFDFDGSVAVDQDIFIPTTLADLTSDATHRVVTDTQISAWGAKYNKPTNGIPSTDLASGVQTSLSNADTAYGWGNHATAGYASDSVVVKQIKVGASGTALSPTSGVVTLPDYPTLSSLGGQPLDADLTAIAGLTGTSGFLKKTAADTWTLDTNSYLTTSATLDNVADGSTRKLSDYVKKAGDTMSGSLTFNNPNNNWTKIGFARDGATGTVGGLDGSGLYFQHTDADSNSAYMYLKANDGLRVNGNIVYTAGNCNSTSVAWFASSLTLNGVISGATYIMFNTYTGIGRGNAFTGNLTATDLCLQAFDGSNYKDIWALCSKFYTNGSLGVGTSSPAYKLDVSGSMRATNRSYFNDGLCTYASIVVYNSPSDTTYRLSLDSDGAIGHLFNYNTSDGTFGTLALNYGGGNVGIGRSYASYKLDVNGTIRVIGSSYAQLQMSDNGDGLMINSKQSTHGYYLLYLSYGESSLGTPVNTAMVVKANGRVGIGLSQPTCELDVNGEINSTRLSIPTSGPGSSAISGHTYFWLGSTGSYVN